MKKLLIIPARYKSSRFPGKPLYEILGKSLISRVWEKCIQAVSSRHVYVATDDVRILDHCMENKIQCVMTSPNCLTGTDRVKEAYEAIGKPYDVIINVQGDEPLIEPSDIIKVIDQFDKYRDDVYCGMCRIDTQEEFTNPNIIKVVANTNGYLMYASRAPIPANKELKLISAYKQVCIYAFNPEALRLFGSVLKTKIEEIEDIEFLRFFDLGHSIKMVEVSSSSISVDIPDDVLKVEKILKEKQKNIMKEFLENAKSKTNRNIAIDFDGVIYNNDNVFDNDGSINGNAIEGALESIKKISEKYNIIIYTCKAHPDRPLVNGKTGVELIWEWLEKNGADEYISEITYEKPWASYYIDDRNIEFKNWNDILELI